VVSKLTDKQLTSLCRAILATRKEEWIRAVDHGERVTLASLHTNGFVKRRAWRGKEGEPDAAYEYQATEQVMAAACQTLKEWFEESPSAPEENDT
jgi:hypothetical protein